MSKVLSDEIKNIKLGDKRFEFLLNNLIKIPSSSIPQSCLSKAKQRHIDFLITIESMQMK